MVIVAAHGRHLLPQLQEFASRTAEERLATWRLDRWIGYPRAQNAIARLEQVLAQPPMLRPPNILIAGPTNNGKSMIAERFRRAHAPSTAPDHEIVPVAAVQMPPSPTVRRFYAGLLAALGSPVSSHNATYLCEQVALKLLRTIGVRVLIIDELHNMLAGTPGQQREFLNLLRFLGNELRVSLVCLGTKEAYLAIRSDDQLENRFEPFPLPRWTDDADLGRLLASFEAVLPLRETSSLGTPELRSLILRRTEGTIGEMAALMTAAVRLALSMGSERLDSAILAAAEYRGPIERRRLFEASVE